MSDTHASDASSIARGATEPFTRLLIGLMAFLTVVDLFAAQALLPSLAQHYAVSPAEMGIAVNACTLGMAAAGLAIALIKPAIEPRTGISASLALLALPTLMLAFAPDLISFSILRIVQGLLMATAFSLMLTHLGMRFAGMAAAGAVAAYITGNVASNLVGRVIAAAVVGTAGLPAAFLAFAALNVLGAVLAVKLVTAQPPSVITASSQKRRSDPGAVHESLDLVASYMIGFCILFAFIGVFTYVNFVLTAPPLSISMMQLGVIYVAFVPSIILTPLAGRLVDRMGTRWALRTALLSAAAGLPLLAVSSLPAVFLGMAMLAAGTFGAQAIATGYITRRSREAGTVASGLYLASYYIGGLAGTIVIGQIFERLGWPPSLIAIGFVLLTSGIAAAAWHDD